MKNQGFSRATLGGACALIFAAIAAPAQAGPLINDVPALQRGFASLLAGHYNAKACGEIPDRQGKGNRPGSVTVSPAGVISIGSLSLSMFDPAAQFALSRHFASAGFGYELSVGGRRVGMTNDKPGGETFVDIGRTEDGGNVSEGQMCADADMRGSRLLSATEPLIDFLAAVYDTGGQTITGDCKNLGRKRGGKREGGESRQASYSVSASTVTLNGKALALKGGAKLAEAGIGSRFADGTLNGDIEWADGANLHIERAFGEGGGGVASFAFAEGEARWFCKPAR